MLRESLLYFESFTIKANNDWVFAKNLYFFISLKILAERKCFHSTHFNVPLLWDALLN